ncbi:MAG: hypothetical protein ACRDTD_01365 [Pseudonocardiaceae bacterium]
MPAAKQLTTLRVPDAPHGTLCGWFMGCRCTWCSSAKRAATETVSATSAGKPRAQDVR